MEFEQATKDLASAFNISLDEAAKRLHDSICKHALTEEEGRDFTELMKNPWWKFWNGWFTKY